MSVVAIYEATGAQAGPSNEQLAQMASMFGGSCGGALRTATPTGKARTVAVFDGLHLDSSRLGPTGTQTFADALVGAAQAVAGTSEAHTELTPTVPAAY